MSPAYTFVFYLLITFFSFLSAFYFEEKILPSKLIGFFIVFISAFIANILYNSKNIPSLIKIYLTFHVSFFYIQFISFYLFKIHIDFLLPITGEEQRVFGGSFEIPYLNSFMRACGLFNEPGTYVTFVAPFIVLFGRWSKCFNRYAKFLYILSLISLFISFSVFGIIFGLIILFFASIFNKKIILILGSLFSITIVVPYITYRFFLINSNINTDTGLGFREVFLSESFKFITSDFGAFLLGSGHLISDPKAKFISSFNDIGLIPYLIHFSGPFLTFTLLSILFQKVITLDKFAIIGIIILFMSKLSILAPFFPFILTILMWPNKNTDYNKSKIF